LNYRFIALLISCVFALSACGKDPQSASASVNAKVGKSVDASTATDTKSGVTNDATASNTFTATSLTRNVIGAMFQQLADEQPDALNDLDFSRVTPRELFPHDRYGPTAPKPDRNGNRLAPSEYQRKQMAGIVAHVLNPVMGWPGKYARSSSAREKYMAMLLVSNIFVDNVFDRILPYVPIEAARQPGEAQKKVRQVWDSISTKELCEIWDRSLAESTLKLTYEGDRYLVNGTGAFPIQFSVGSFEVHGDAKGFAYMQGGNPMFDDQHIGGRKIELAMDRGEATTASSGFSTNNAVKAGGSKGVSGSADLKGQ
jgi:hypothetical protein